MNKKDNVLGIIAGFLLIINTAFLPLVKIKIPFFGDYSIGFFKGLSNFTAFSKDIKRIEMILIFSGTLFVILGVLLIYSGYQENKNLLKYSTLTSFIFLLIFYVILFIKLPGGEIGKFISVSMLKILIYIVVIVLGYMAYRKVKVEESSMLIENKIEESESNDE